MGDYRPHGYDQWTDVGGTGAGYGPPSEAYPVGFHKPSRIVVAPGGYRPKAHDQQGKARSTRKQDTNP